MWILALAIIAAPALGDEPGPAELVKLLGSADRAEREEAAEPWRGWEPRRCRPFTTRRGPARRKSARRRRPSLD